MQPVQPRFLEYFVALAREKHFARAAAVCNVTQPTLSGGIAQLEQLLGGTRLVIRDRRFVGLTPEGAAILPWAQQIIAAHEGLRTELLAQGGPLKGELRIGVIPAAGPAVGELVGAVRSRHPQVDVEIRTMTSRQIEQALADRELHAGLTYLDNEPLTDVIAIPIYPERFVFATGMDGPLAGRSAVSWSDAARVPLCLLHQGMQNRRILDAHLASLDLSVKPAAIADSYVALIAMVGAGGLSTILPHGYGRFIRSDANVLLREFSDSVRLNSVGLVVLDQHPMPGLARAAADAARTIASATDLGPL